MNDGTRGRHRKSRQPVLGRRQAVKAATGAAAVLAFLLPATAALLPATAAHAATATSPVTSPANAANAILPAPEGDAFYTPPNPLPPGKPGDVIWYREVTPLASNIPASTVYQVLYRSADARGNAIAVSGDVFVPKAKWTGKGTRPLVAYASGTQGWGPQCAPSKEIA